jgi:hypothetical protein
MARGTKWFIYRDQPFRVLHDSGRGFMEPRPARERGFHIWYFLDRSLVRRLVRELNQTSPTSYDEAKNLKREGRPLERQEARNGPVTKPLPKVAAPLLRNETIDDL